jgi:hypothetical protein
MRFGSAGTESEKRGLLEEMPPRCFGWCKVAFSSAHSLDTVS